MKIHDIKLQEVFFGNVMNDIRTFVIVENRMKCQKGDILVITEVCPIKKRSPRKTIKTITFIESGSGTGLSINYSIACLIPCNYEVGSKSGYASQIPYHDQVKIIEYWKTHKENGINDLVKVFLYKKTAINNVINNHLKPKPNGQQK